MDFTIRGERVLVDGIVRPAAIVIQSGTIAEILNAGTEGSTMPVIDAGDTLVMPGVVDTHAHINEPGRTEWEGFQTATKACAAGGTTTVVDMPLNSIPATTSLESLRIKAAAVEKHAHVDYGFWGGVVPGNASELEPMAAEGALGFKCFLIESGVPEFLFSTEADLSLAMPILSRLGLPLLVHAELEGPLGGDVPPEHSRDYKDYLHSRPRNWEDRAIRFMIDLCRKYNCRVHIVHLSSTDALPDIRKAKAEGLPLTVETCPHYLSFTAEEIIEGATHFKCAPPIRERENRDRLWEAVKDRTIDFIVSDHSPCTPTLKHLDKGDFFGAWGGISSLQLSPAIVWSGLVERGLGPADFERLVCRAPAQFSGLGRRKGRIAKGFDADIVFFADDEKFVVRPDQIRHRHALTPYEGRRLRGVVKRTILRGTTIYSDDSQTPVVEGAGKRQRIYQERK